MSNELFFIQSMRNLPDFPEMSSEIWKYLAKSCPVKSLKCPQRLKRISHTLIFMHEIFQRTQAYMLDELSSAILNMSLHLDEEVHMGFMHLVES